MLAKIVNGKLVLPSEAERQKIVITNPSEESLKFNLGYKELTVDQRPSYDSKTQELKAVLKETDTAIIQHWEILSKIK